MNPELFLFGLTLLLYFAGSVCHHVHVFGGSERARKFAMAGTVAGLIAHTAALGFWCTSHAGSILRDPGMPFSLVAFFLALAQIAVDFRSRWASVGALSMPLAFICQFYANLRSTGSAAAVTTPNPLFSPHVLMSLLGFAAFALAFCLAVIYLGQSRLLKAKQVRGAVLRLPPLESVATAAHRLATIGLSMLTLSIITGAISAPSRWGADWYLDPKMLTSVVAWAIYAAYLAASTLMGWRGRRTTYFLIAGFVVVLVAFFVSLGRGSGAGRVPAQRVEGPGAGGRGIQVFGYSGIQGGRGIRGDAVQISAVPCEGSVGAHAVVALASHCSRLSQDGTRSRPGSHSNGTATSVGVRPEYLNTATRSAGTRPEYPNTRIGRSRC